MVKEDAYYHDAGRLAHQGEEGEIDIDLDDLTQMEGVFDLDGLDTDDVEDYEEILWESHSDGVLPNSKPGLK